MHIKAGQCRGYFEKSGNSSGAFGLFIAVMLRKISKRRMFEKLSSRILGFFGAEFGAEIRDEQSARQKVGLKILVNFVWNQSEGGFCEVFQMLRVRCCFIGREHSLAKCATGFGTAVELGSGCPDRDHLRPSWAPASPIIFDSFRTPYSLRPLWNA